MESEDKVVYISAEATNDEIIYYHANGYKVILVIDFEMVNDKVR